MTPTMQTSKSRRVRKFLGIGLVLGAGLAIFGAVGGPRALAEEAKGAAHGAFMRHMVSKRLDAALDAAKVSDPQRQAIHAARDHVFDTVAQTRHGQADLDKALSLFESDKIDRDQLHAIRQGRETEMKAIGDAIEQAVSDTHDALTPAQRKVVADYVRQHHHQHQ